MLHLSADMYNNEQVSIVFSRISAKTCLKMDYFEVNPKKCQTLEALPPDPLSSGAHLG